MIRLLLFILLIVFSFTADAQYQYYQYFDGKDTSISNSLIVKKDTGANNIWQVGRPQKMIFDSAATKPYAMITDTINNYPANNKSSFTFRFSGHFGPPVGIVAIQWKQKLDMVKKHSGGYIEYTIDSGKTWQNVFNNSHVYNFYGFDTSAANNSRDTLNGIYTFSGTDTNWRDIWLCFKTSLYKFNDSTKFRFTFISDTSSTTGEGWMIDNLIMHKTYYHTITNNANEAAALKVYPTATRDFINITIAEAKDKAVLKKILLLNTEGKLVQQYIPGTNTYKIDCRSFPSGVYYVKVITDNVVKTFPVTVHK